MVFFSFFICFMLFFNCHTHSSNDEKHEVYQAVSEAVVSFYSFGIPPWEYVSEMDKILAKMESNVQNPSCVAIGEIGLDKRLKIEMKLQIELFKKQILISERQKLPVIIHCVKAWNELKVVKRTLKPIQPWVFHGFSKFSLLEEVVTENLMVSLGAGILVHPNAHEIVSKIPDEQLLLETDTSDVAIEIIYAFVAEIKKISLQELSEIVEHNFKNTFQKWVVG